MANVDPFQLEDQTDEDFFDKLVDDDEFGLSGSSSTPIEVTRAVSVEDQLENLNSELIENPERNNSLTQMNSFPIPHNEFNEVIQASAEIGSPGSSTEISAGSKGTGIKEVQWTSFSGSGSFSDFFPEAQDRSVNSQPQFSEVNSFFDQIQTEQIQDLSIASSQMISAVNSQPQFPELNTSFDQIQTMHVQDLSITSSQTVSTANNETEYWENAYPGWKYDASSGQWYQVESYDSTGAQSDAYSSTAVNNQENQQVNNFSDLSFQDQNTALSATEEISSGNIAAVTAGSDEKSSEYPQNMIFDAHYPGWYYDTNTYQWYSLESYTQSLATTVPGSSFSDVHQTVHQSIQQADQSSEIHNLESVQNQVQTLSFLPNQGQDDWSGKIKSDYSSSIEPKNQAQKRTEQQISHQTSEFAASSHPSNSFSTFMPSDFSYQTNVQPITTHQSQSYFPNQNLMNYSQFPQSNITSNSHYQLDPNVGRTLDGRPPHALVTFGFGGKLIVMKDKSMGYGSQDAGKGEITILNLSEVAVENSEASVVGSAGRDYFQVLCKQPFPGPLVGSSASTRDLNKWIDENIVSCDSLTADGRKAELLKLLLSLLKISCQYYGKLRSPFGADPSLQEADSPEIAVTRLFSSAKKNNHQMSESGDLIHCMRSMPSEAKIRATALEVQNLLVSGRRKDALQCAQEGQLWGPALILAAQLGDKYYVETVKQMAHRQFVSGSPLRTLCLLIAGQPADVFSIDHSISNSTAVWNMPQQPAQASPSGMLDDWEENLAIITANRTKDDELVIINLGDCLWKETGEVTAAHMCYLVAEANFESYSDKARLCLVGADHWRCPRTYASPEAIQRTELFEYSKVSGNSQFVLLPFQPYKLVYAHMLAEMGKVSDSLKYCQAIMKSLKSSGRDPEVETWKGMVSSLEERLRAHQQGGYGTNLAPGKLVGKLFTSIDRSLHRMIGAPPASLPPLPPGHINTQEHDYMSATAPKFGTMAPSPPLASSASDEAISGWTADPSRKTMQSRSVSEPDFGRTPKQEPANSGTKSSTPPTKTRQEGSRFGLLGSQLFQKTVGWMSRNRQAKLGESNKFYYDEKLKRWVEEGAEAVAEAGPPPPPPTMASFNTPAAPQFGSTNIPPAETPTSNGMVESFAPAPLDHGSGVPPAPPSMNQFSARSRIGVRSRYVDTFNKGGGGTPAMSFQTPSRQAAKPAAAAKFFVPMPVAASEPAEEPADAPQPVQGDPPTASSSSTPSSSSASSSMPSSAMQRFPSMDNISARRPPPQDAQSSLGSRTRASSWSGAYPGAFNHHPSSSSSSSSSFPAKPSFFSPNNGPFPSNLGTGHAHANNRGFGDDLQEVEL